MRYAYVTVIEADDETGARSYAERTMQAEEKGSPCVMLGGGAPLSDVAVSRYTSGLVAAAVARYAFAEDLDDCERLSVELHRAAIR